MQRRDGFRCSTALDIRFRKLSPDAAKPIRTPRTVTRAVNLSEGGMRAELDGLFAPGDRIECALHVAVDFIRTDKRGPGMF